jgi:polar amino acid transport system substrate-binding protein
MRTRLKSTTLLNSTTLLRSLVLGAIAVLMVTGVLACAAGPRGGAAGTFTPRTPGTLTIATAQIPDPGFWQGTPEHPTGGFEYELARALAGRFGLDHVKVIIVPFAQLVAGHLHGADLALSDITITTQRARYVSFSEPYLDAPPSILVRPGTEVADVKSARALRFAVQTGTTLETALQDEIRPYEAPLILDHQREALHALRRRRVNAVMLDLPVALAYARESPRAYAVAAQLPSEDGLGIALAKGSENLEAVNSALRALESDGTIERLGHEWLHASVQEGQAEAVPVLRTGE